MIITSLHNALEKMSRSLKEYIADYLSQTELFEMAIDRNTFKKRVESIFPQIAQNWCLIRYARVNDTHANLVNHWKTELITHLDSIYAMKLKSGSEYKTIVDVIIKKWEYNDAKRVVHSIIEPKFYKEGITDNEYKISLMFASEIDYICKLLDPKNKLGETIYEYIKRL